MPKSKRGKNAKPASSPDQLVKDLDVTVDEQNAGAKGRTASAVRGGAPTSEGSADTGKHFKYDVLRKL